NDLCSHYVSAASEHPRIGSDGIRMAGEMKGSGIMNAAQVDKTESSRMSCTALCLAWSIHRSHEEFGEHLRQSRPGNAWNFQRQ
ncbi:MAG: hypothetical protein M3414_06545, partial [Pseudomonadota bacterium]|nr:hypothetical protein [Pseudomonadota bacterium]